MLKNETGGNQGDEDVERNLIIMREMLVTIHNRAQC